MSNPEENEHEYIAGEFEEMDLEELKDKIYMVAISTGPQDKGKYICNTVCGPYDFYEMVDTVGNIWQTQQVHAKAFVPSKMFGEPPQVLDANTIDFIEARFLDISMDGMLDGSLLGMKGFTCKAGFIREEEGEEDDA